MRTLYTAKTTYIALCTLALSMPALAESGEGGNNIFAGDIGNVLWTLVVFGLVLFVLGKYAWGPLLESLQAREDFIRESLETAKKDRDEAEGRLKQYDDKLTEARAEATAIVEEGRRDSEVLRQRIEEEAKVEAEKMIQRAKREINIAKETAVKELYGLSGTLATDIAARIVGRELKTEDHQRLIDDSISELERLGTN
ncbi:MAG: F0F1 ATP synthase subunit B [bacterium]|nr:F0F1 ATP synthase subunit B [bacterium]